MYAPAYPEPTTATIEGPEITADKMAYRFVRAVGAKG
jgi:PRTRC genetic system protein C